MSNKLLKLLYNLKTFLYLSKMINNCAFCKIINNEIPCFKIAEDENFLAIIDISQLVEGHTIVIPKKHFETFTDVDDVDDYFEFATKVARHFKKDLGYKFVDIFVLGRGVPHAHIHLIPHNDDNPEWKEALSKIGSMQDDQSRRKSSEEYKRISDKFAMSN